MIEAGKTHAYTFRQVDIQTDQIFQAQEGLSDFPNILSI